MPPLALFGIAVALSYLVSLLFPGLQMNHPVFTLSGITLLILGELLFFWAGHHLWRHNTAIHSHHKPSRLVIKGPYGISRNPMYLGLLLITIGTALLFANVLAFVGPILFFVFISMLVIPLEESMLSRSFGNSYRSYRSKIRRWL